MLKSKIYLSKVIPILLLVIFSNCENEKIASTKENGQGVVVPHLPYSFNEPNTTFDLPNKLKEISGLGINQDGEFLYAVQDEEGILFKIGAKDGVVMDSYKFSKDGDYEGVEYVNGRYFSINSKGTLFEILNPGTENQTLNKHKFSFYKRSDIEGLGYDRQSNSLLFSAKGVIGKGKAFKAQKGIYQISLNTLKIKELPKYTITLKAVKAFLKDHKDIAQKKALEKLFEPDSKFTFGPSGIAVHPITKDIYITSSIGKLLVILDSTGIIKHIVKLKKKIHQQPEGICFDQNGTLYISNEGKTKKGMIHVFYPLK